MKTILLIIGIVTSCFFFIPPASAEMTFSEFQIFCSEKDSQNWELLSIEQRQRFLLCNFSDILSEKYYDWIGIERDWKNFAKQVSLEYAQTIPQYSETGVTDSLIVNPFVSGRESFPPPMGSRISFYYLDGDKTKRFFEVYQTNLLGDFEKIRDYRTPTLKLFKMGYDLNEIKCKENLVLIKKHDGSPACVTPYSIPELIKRNWTTTEVLMNMPLAQLGKECGHYSHNEFLSRMQNHTFDAPCHDFIIKKALEDEKEMLEQGYLFDTKEQVWKKDGFPDTMMSISYHYMINLEVENEN